MKKVKQVRHQDETDKARSRCGERGLHCPRTGNEHTEKGARYITSMREYGTVKKLTIYCFKRYSGSWRQSERTPTATTHSKPRWRQKMGDYRLGRFMCGKTSRSPTVHDAWGRAGRGTHIPDVYDSRRAAVLVAAQTITTFGTSTSAT